MSFTTWLLRKMFTAGDDKRDRGLTTPDDIERWDDICYGTNKKWQVMDIYRPKNTTGKLPVIVSIHGGGWTYGDKERYQYYCMSLAQRGFAVVNFTYRVAPEFQFPAGIEDTGMVFQWLHDNKDCGWFDFDHIYAVGDSAGAHMLTIYCAACGNPEYAKKLGIIFPKYPSGKNICPNAVGLNCGVYEIDMRTANGMIKGLMKALLKSKINDPAEIDLINPIPYINDKFPRAYIMTASADPLAGPPKQKNLTDKLAACGIEFVDKTYGSKENPLNHVFHCDMRNETGKLCNDEECCFFLQEFNI